ncbi:hypothetical protein J7T55_002547 [Diaporthe amygdali]|uniref:uncharacterized protein n=1 Tax=Phomopsis amygdali TaxID=1214568 RepID=UPI0022FF02F7|nr:uncharacterized protein J7T55_002547 [Diaporthe amygdali]KAJ0122036.1 hypothetical protein J7T55_002547 [Diaporthe amygdali]
MFKKISGLRKKTTDADGRSLAADDDNASVISGAESRNSLAITPTFGVPDRRRDPSPSGLVAESGPLGLNVVYTPDNGRKVDIVFIHGLGGTSRWTWSKHKNAELFWPLTFLPLEQDLCLARILTFGYNAAFQKAGNVSLSLLDFAKDLLFDLKYGKDPDMDELDMGKVPIIFVVHSMGGLIVKEVGVNSIPGLTGLTAAITFLATPHRGTALAQTLNRILDSVMINSKQYVAELARNSLTLQKLNEQFRHVAPRLDIVSFYETMPTRIKSARVMVLEKESSVLGYPGEVSKALIADHHGVCKYEGPQDPNYITIRNVLKSLVSKIITKDNGKQPELSDRRAALDLKSMLALSELPGLDYIFFRDQWTEDTNNWINNDKTLLQWRDSVDDLSLLWLNGGAATGKSILVSTIINNLVQEGLQCQYFFIRHGDRKKRSLSFLLRSLAFQIGQSVPGLAQQLNELKEEGIDFETVDPKVIWDRVFKSVIFRSAGEQPFYWVIDGLDEAESPRNTIKLLLDVTSSSPIRILFASRRTPEITNAFEKRHANVSLQTIDIDEHPEDIGIHVRQELKVAGGLQLRETIEQKIVEKSQKNFLWARLAVENVNQCHTLEDIDSALEQLPEGMEALYDRMASSVNDISNPRDKLLATKILQCLTCSLRVLSVSEMTQALGETASGILDLPHAIKDLCGGFASVDNDGNVSIIHQSAREYLLEDSDQRIFSLDEKTAHKDLFLSSLRCLTSTGLRTKLARDQAPEFVKYAAASWSTHLLHIITLDDEVIKALKRFLTGSWMLTWIHALATTGQLRILAQTSKDLYKLCRNDRSTHSVLESLDQELVSSWSVDLLRIMGRFGSLLRRNPDSIYSSIPPFCPKGSSVHQLFGKTDALSVNGISNEKWDDLFARISIGKSFASSIQVAGSQVAVLAAPGNVHIYESTDFREAKSSPIQHGERVDRVQLNKAGSLLASYGYRTTKVWRVSSGECILTVDSVESKTRPLAMLFTNDDSTLLVGSDDRRVRSLNLVEKESAWDVIADMEEAGLEKHFTNSASHMAFSPDGSMIAVGYRRHPASAWELEGSTHIGYCRREDDVSMVRELRDLVWHPYQPEILGLSVEGVVSRWSPYEDRVDELSAGASKLAISNDGELFVTGDSHGRVRLYTTASFSLLHQLSSQDAIFGLAFSPDSKRFYDIRGYHANAWEPNALARYAESSGVDVDSISEYSMSHVSQRSASASAAVDPITAIAGSPIGQLYCYGTQTGVVNLHDTKNGKIATLYASRAKFAIDHIAWSHDGEHICCSDFSKQLIVFAASSSTGDLKPNYDQKALIPIRKITKSPIIQLLFHRTTSHLLVYTALQVHTVSLTSYAVESSKQLDCPISCWAAHPSDASLLVGFGALKVMILDWSLEEKRVFTIEWPHNPGTEKSQTSQDLQVDRVLASQDQKHILLQVSNLGRSSRDSELLFLEAASLSASKWSEDHAETTSPTVCLRRFSSELFHGILLPLGLVWGGRLIYISRDFAVCSTQLKWTSKPMPSSNIAQARNQRNLRQRSVDKATTMNPAINVNAQPMPIDRNMSSKNATITAANAYLTKLVDALAAAGAR